MGPGEAWCDLEPVREPLRYGSLQRVIFGWRIGCLQKDLAVERELVFVHAPALLVRTGWTDNSTAASRRESSVCARSGIVLVHIARQIGAVGADVGNVPSEVVGESMLHAQGRVEVVRRT